MVKKLLFVLISLSLSTLVESQTAPAKSWEQTKAIIERALKNENYEQAVDLLKSAIETSQSSLEQAEAYILYADLATKSGDYDATDFYIQKAQTLVSELGNTPLENNLTLSKLKLLFSTGHSKKVIDEINQLLKLDQTKKDKVFRLRLLSLIGTAYMANAQYEKSLIQINQVIVGFEELQMFGELSNAMQNKAYCLLKQAKYDSIEILLHHSIKLAKQEEYIELELEGIILIGKYYQALEKPDVALAHLAWAEQRLNKMPSRMLGTRSVLALFYRELYESTGDYKEALNWYKQAQTLNDSLNREDATLRNAFDDSMQTIAKQQQELSRNEIFLGLLLVGLAVIGVVVYVQRRNLRIRVKMTKQLKEQNEALKLQRETLVSQKAFIESRSLKLVSYLLKLEQLANSSQLSNANSQDAFIEICAVVYGELSVNRVSIWKYHAEESAIRCNLMYVDGQVVDNPVVLNEQDYPIYFNAIKKKSLIVADDINSEPLTQELKERHINEIGITSMVDVPFLLYGELAGIICCEHTGEQRAWQPEDTIFLRAIGDFISITLLAEKISMQNEALQNSNLSLEDAVKMRTLELELQNKQLAEYAFINSHLLRSPLAKILGISDIMKKELGNSEHNQLLDSLIASADELDTIIKRIGLILHKGDHLSRKEINSMRKNYPVD